MAGTFASPRGVRPVKTGVKAAIALKSCQAKVVDAANRASTSENDATVGLQCNGNRAIVAGADWQQEFSSCSASRPTKVESSARWRSAGQRKNHYRCRCGSHRR